MKTSRLITYGALGIIAGLLIENRALLTREQIKDKARQLKDKFSKGVEKLHEH